MQGIEGRESVLLRKLGDREEVTFVPFLEGQSIIGYWWAVKVNGLNRYGKGGPSRCAR